jgi:hypothetical protein
VLHEVSGRKHAHPEMGARDRKSLEPVLEAFRTGIAHYRAQGATEQRIRQILGEAIWLAFQQVTDPDLRAWLCDEFSKAARVPLIPTNHPSSRKLH